MLLLLPCRIFSQQIIDTQAISKKPHIVNNSSNHKYHIYMPDTSEQALVKQFQDMMNNAETVMDAQVISMESKWGMFYDETFPKGNKEIYTVVTFKVHHWIKGTLQSDVVKFNIEGGNIGDTVTTVTHIPRFELNHRAIYFFKNKEQNTYLYYSRQINIWGAFNGRHCQVDVGVENVDAENYVNIFKTVRFRIRPHIPDIYIN